MEQIEFSFENIKNIEVFAGVTLYTYYNIGVPSATFKFPLEEGESQFTQRELKLFQGEIIYKDENNNLYKKLN